MQALVLIDKGAAHLASTLVSDRVLRTGESLAMAVRRDALRFARLRRVVAKRGARSFAIGADTLASD